MDAVTGPEQLGGIAEHGDVLALTSRKRLLNAVAAEADSWEFYSDKSAFERDCRRYNRLVLAEWTVLRSTWQQVMLGSRWVVQELRGRPSSEYGLATAGNGSHERSE